MNENSFQMQRQFDFEILQPLIIVSPSYSEQSKYCCQNFLIFRQKTFRKLQTNIFGKNLERYFEFPIWHWKGNLYLHLLISICFCVEAAANKTTMGVILCN